MFEFQPLKGFKRKNFQKLPSLEPQEILLDKLAKRKAMELGISERRFEIPLSGKVLQLTYIIFLVLAVIVFQRTIQLQVIQGKEFSELAEKNKFIIYQIKAVRGVIYDQEMEQLVFNQPSFDLYCYPQRLPEEPEKSSVLNKAALILEINMENLKEIIDSSKKNQVLVAENLSHQKLITWESQISDLPGFEIEKNSVREYKDGETFAHLLGYMGKINTPEFQEEPGLYSVNDYVGREGLEYFYEDVLRKNPGKLQVERDALGNIISKETIQVPESGDSLVLNINAGLQRKIESELKNQLREVGAGQAIGIAMNPNNGAVLALVSLPSFDNNLFSYGDKESIGQLLIDKNDPLFNRAISGMGYPTGSVIKPLIAIAGLEEGIINPDQTINCQGEISVDNIYYDPDNPESGPEQYVYHDLHAHGITDLKKAIAQSCNVYFYRLGGGYKEQEGLGALKIEEYLEKFGWGEPTNIDLAGEGMGTLPEIDKDWTLGNTYHLSIGQGAFAVTPLQIANAFAAIANGGTLYQPQVVKEVISSEGTKEIESQIIRQSFVNSNNLEVVKEGMRQTVTDGSAKGWLDTLPVEVAAKTGTSQTSEENYYHNWVVVFGPYEKAEIVLVIGIFNVENIRAAALPVARNVLNWYFNQ